MLLAEFSLIQSLFLQAMTHGTVHIVTRAKEPCDIVLCVALPQKSDEFVTLFIVQVRRKVRVHAELRSYCVTSAIQWGECII